jgi:ankyrin repeat protein
MGTVARLITGAGGDVNYLHEGQPLLIAVLKRYKEMGLEAVTTLFDLGADVRVPAQPSGVTALMCAAATRNPELVQLILSKAADARAAARDGTTALHSVFDSVQHDYEEKLPSYFVPAAPIVQLLLAAGASPTAADREGKLPAQRLECAVAAVLEEAQRRKARSSWNVLDTDVLLTDAEAVRRMLSG